MTPATATVDRLREAHDRKREADAPADAKAFSTLAARYAIAGWQLWRTDAADGPQRLFAARWGQVTRPMADMAEAERFLSRVTGAKP